MSGWPEGQHHRLAATLGRRLISVPDQTQALQRQIRVHPLDSRRLASDDVSHPPGRDACRTLASLELDAHAGDDAIDHRDVSKEKAGLHGSHGGTADNRGRLSNVDPGKASRPLK